MKRIMGSPRTRNILRKVLPRPMIESLKNVRKTLQVLSSVYREEGRLRNRRFIAIEEIADYLVGAQIQGDYLEFGVYQGNTFSYAVREIAHLFKDMQFIALDSFEGLPEPGGGVDAKDTYASSFYKGQFACSKDAFLSRLRKDGCPMDRIRIVKGWFDQILVGRHAGDLEISKVAVAWIDCDLYESTVPVLRFLTDKLSIGSVIAFDDWRCYRNLPDFGEQRACREWLQSNPQIQLRELFSFGWHGLVFTVGAC